MGGGTQLTNSQLCPICLAALPIRTPRNASNSGLISSNSKFNRDRCDEEVATPECCDHTFCLSCIKEWSKVRACYVHVSIIYPI